MTGSSLMSEIEKIDEELDRLLGDINNSEPGSKEYSTMLDQLTKLYRVKTEAATLEMQMQETNTRQAEMDANRRLKEIEADAKERALTEPKRISPDTLATIGANLLGIMIIIGHERAHVVTSKALGFIMKLR